MSPHDDQPAEHASMLRPHASGRQGVGVPRAHAPAGVELQPDVVARLEWLDDLMFAAIDGDPVALDIAVHAWERTCEELGKEAVEESRRQYLRRAQSVWNSLRYESTNTPHKIFAAIEIISLLAGKAKLA